MVETPKENPLIFNQGGSSARTIVHHDHPPPNLKNKGGEYRGCSNV